MQQVIDNILNDIQITLSEEFAQNFVRKSFFNNPPWDTVIREPGIGSLMFRTGDLKNSIHNARQGLRLIWQSDTPYAGIHNEGGTINRTSKRGKSYVINMPQRQYMGAGDEVNDIINDVIDTNLPPAINEFFNLLINSTNNG